jgi:hypothetical protein
MAKQTLKDALGADLLARPTTSDTRFTRAEAYFSSPASEPPVSPERAKVVRDGFTMPASDYALIAQLQTTALQAGLSVTKSEVLRAGLQVLSQLTAVDLTQALRGLEKVKTGRAAKRL